ncbi:hypothetical protein C5C00_08480 [Rathayibacter rathayi]|uniref:hypothetical protein n=1 Tax=Rathayibacter rathayi TaxID=33887 RepID=UPI000CE92315|nr:hypothetical protein [Rathayibacter rathayi]PPG88319.1 hypothetical protein C5C47_08010 [Rathayibacter rathayi]PPG96672.1 hypothetical protein C5C00_08480 [Rathayibacter rathayi]
MSGYSEQSQRLARQLAEKAAKNLRRSGRSVEQDATTGRYIVGPRGGGSISATARTGGSHSVIAKDGPFNAKSRNDLG